MSSGSSAGGHAPVDREKKRKEVGALLRSCLMSSKGGVPLETVNRDYRGLVGEGIPYRSMGYQSLEAYVDHAMYDVCRVSRDRNGGYCLHALATQETAHIAAMVSAQKTKQPKKRPRPIRQPLQQWRPPQQNNRGRPGVPPMGSRPYAGGRGGAASMRMAPQSIQQQKQQLQQQQMRRIGGSVGGQPRNLRPVQQQQQQQPQQQQQQQHRQQNWGNQPGSYKQQPNRTGDVRENRTNQQSSSPGSGGGNKVELGFHKKQLESFCASKNISMEFKTALMSNKKYVSTVIVGGNASDGGGGHRFKAYPNEFPSAAMAEDAASKAALDALPSSTPKHPPSSANAKAPESAKQPLVNGHAKMSNGAVDTRDLSQLLERVVSLVGDRTNGIWTTRIEVEYKERWKSDVPERWISAVIKDGRVEVDEPIPGRYIMKPSFKVQQKQEEKPTPGATSSATTPTSANAVPVRSEPQQPNAPKVSKPVSNGSTPAAASAVTQPRPPPITYPKEDVWDVYITNVYSTVNVWLRFLNDEYQSSFDDLVTEMELFFFDYEKMPTVDQPQIGMIYAAKVDSEWHRVEITDVRGIWVTCFYIDEGEKVATTVENIRELPGKFLALPAQAVSVRLVGLEAFADTSSALHDVQREIETKALVAQVQSREPNNIALVLHDTSKEEDVNLNERLLLRLDPDAAVALSAASSSDAVASPPLCTSPLNLPKGTTLSELAGGLGMDDLLPLELASLKTLIPPDVPGVDDYFDVNVTLAASPSNFTVQPWTSLEKLEELEKSMQQFYSSDGARKPVTKKDLEQDCFFAAFSDSMWRRVRVNAMLDEFTVAVRFVDHGDFSMMNIDCLQLLCSSFRDLPMQAVNASLADIIPTNGDWSPADTLKFSKRVVNRQFVSAIKEKQFDDKEGMFKVWVSLIDTTDAHTDVFVEQELVDANTAVRLCI